MDENQDLNVNNHAIIDFTVIVQWSDFIFTVFESFICVWLYSMPLRVVLYWFDSFFFKTDVEKVEIDGWESFALRRKEKKLHFKGWDF